jgi:Family of unknown function (DUF5715)
MCRTLTLLVALAAFMAASVHVALASTVKSHRKASGLHAEHGSSAHPAVRHPVVRHPDAHPAVRHPVERHPVERHPKIHHPSRHARHPEESRGTAHGTAARSASQPTPQEVGRAAGLRIRRELEQRAANRRRRSRQARFRRAELVEARYTPERPEPVAAPAYVPQSASAPRRTQPPDAPAPDNRIDSRIDNRAPAPGQAVIESGIEPDNGPGTSAQPSAERGAEPVADLPSAEPPAESESDSDMASLAIPRGAMPAPLKGSLASLERQNERLTSEGLERILNENDLAARIANHLLVPVPVSDALTINPDLPINHRYCRPWTAKFLADLARDHEAVFHRPLEVSSAVRTVQYQRELMRVNGNAAPAQGDIVSPHLTGATIDIAKKGLTRDEVKWMRRRLLQLEDEGKIDVEEEFRQACFHITVYTTYDPGLRMGRPHPQYTPPAPQDEADRSDTEGL